MDRPEPEGPKRPAGWLPLLLAAGVGIMILTALVMLTGGYLGLVIVVGGGVFAMAAFHYLVWGWWLSDKLRRDEAEAERRAALGPEAQAARQSPWYYFFLGGWIGDMLHRDEQVSRARIAAEAEEMARRREESGE
jgi:hypothetical protein